MHPKTHQEILCQVDQPSRYLGLETNRIVKPADAVVLRIALAFPDLYEIGTSHFGLQILYHLLNGQEDVAAERVYAPAEDMEALLRQAGLPLTTLETGTPLAQCDLIGFSLLYELGYTNMLAMLDLAGLPLLAKDRGQKDPLVIAGGPCTCNPEPVADFFDAMVIGDGESVTVEMVSALRRWKEGGDRSRPRLLREWARIEGVYVPSLFDVVGGGETIRRVAPNGVSSPVRRAVVADLNDAPFPTSPIVPFARPVHDRLRMEIARGCTRGCRFCQAGMIYRPVRERHVDNLLALTEASLAETGYEDLSLLSLSTGDYSHITELAQRLMGRCEAGRVAISLPSLRAGTLTPALMEQVRRVRKTGFTLAPEAGTQRLRDVINKNITEEDIFQTVRNAFDMGWKLIKLYFMVGLPTETEADLEGIVRLVQSLRGLRGPGGRRGQINVSVGTFVPKAHTPFQWAGQIDLETARQRIGWLRDRLRLPGVQFKWQNPETSVIEGLWSRGDRRLCDLLVAAFERGCRFDGWSDRFRFDLWQEAMAACGISLDEVISRQRERDEALPWDHIDARVQKAFLWKEWQRANEGDMTADCRQGDCQGCGACDFTVVAPRLALPGEASEKAATLGPVEKTDRYKTLRVWYRKIGAARFFGHLELVNIFSRAIRRGGIAVKYSEGFHPKQRISFEDPLPVGLESLEEAFFLTVSKEQRADHLVEALNRHLPQGLDVTGCRIAEPRSGRRSARAVRYRVEQPDAPFERQALERFSCREAWILERIRAKGKIRRIDLKKAVWSMEPSGPHRLEMVLSAEPGQTVRPSDVLAEVFGFSQGRIRKSRICKIESLRESEPAPTSVANKEER